MDLREILIFVSNFSVSRLEGIQHEAHKKHVAQKDMPICVCNLNISNMSYIVLHKHTLCPTFDLSGCDHPRCTTEGDTLYYIQSEACTCTMNARIHATKYAQSQMLSCSSCQCHLCRRRHTGVRTMELYETEALSMS